MTGSSGKDREAPYSHFLQGFMPIFFTIIWVLDSFVFGISTVLNAYIHISIRIILFVSFLCFALFVMKISHDTLFKDHEPSKSLITSGILGYIRHPLYFGIQLIYISLIWLSLSLISIGIFIIIFLVYNWMVNQEDKILKELFGQEFDDYKHKVGKWLPKLKKIE
jgi:protein-S-isoprenylcysteine O-methyltransferase Ste14